jgi:hypothetical protein
LPQLIGKLDPTTAVCGGGVHCSLLMAGNDLFASTKNLGCFARKHRLSRISMPGISIIHFTSDDRFAT